MHCPNLALGSCGYRFWCELFNFPPIDRSSCLQFTTSILKKLLFAVVHGQEQRTLALDWEKNGN